MAAASGAASDVAMETGVRAAGSGDVTAPAEKTAGKRVVKLTPKALAEKCEKLQACRKAKFNMASNTRDAILGFMSNNEKVKVQNALDVLVELCNEAKCMHENLLGVVPSDEQVKQDIWFQAKMLSYNDCIANAEQWVAEHKGDDDDDDEGDDGTGETKNEISVVHKCVETNETKQNDDAITEVGVCVTEHLDDEITANDSVSNIESNHSNSSAKSGKSSTASAKLIAESDRAALVARMAKLKEKHDLEEQEQALRRKREQLELDVELAATTARLDVLHSENKSCSKAPSNAIKSCVVKETRGQENIHVLNPKAN